MANINEKEGSDPNRTGLPGYGLSLYTGPYLPSLGALQSHLSPDTRLPNALVGVSSNIACLLMRRDLASASFPLRDIHTT